MSWIILTFAFLLHTTPYFTSTFLISFPGLLSLIDTILWRLYTWHNQNPPGRVQPSLRLFSHHDHTLHCDFHLHICKFTSIISCRFHWGRWQHAQSLLSQDLLRLGLWPLVQKGGRHKASQYPSRAKGSAVVAAQEDRRRTTQSNDEILEYDNTSDSAHFRAGDHRDDRIGALEDVRRVHGWEQWKQVAISVHPNYGQFSAIILLNHLYVDIEVSHKAFCVITWLLLTIYYFFRAEEYKFPRTTIQIRLLRNFFLELTIVSALLVFWINQNSRLECWETTIGQEVYRILITDFFFHTIGTCCYYFLRYLVHKWVTEKNIYFLENYTMSHTNES